MEFNLTRFGNHIRRDITFGYRTYINYLITPFLLGFIFMLFTKDYSRPAQGLTQFIFIFMLIFVFCGTASGAFSGYKTTRKRIANIIIPVSTEEKWLSEFLEHYIVLPICAILMLFAGTSLGELVFSQKLIQTPFIWRVIIDRFSFYNISFFYALISVLFFGSLFYKKLSLFKTLGTLFVFVIIYGVVMGYIAVDSVREFTNVTKPDMGALFEYGVAMEHYTRPLEQIIYSLIAVGFIVLSYIRLKKEEQT